MSGIAGFVSLSGAPADLALADRMAAAVAYCGPDRQDRWSDGPVFMAHALLATTREETADRQPRHDGGLTLIADARIDGRDTLLRDLRAAGRQVASGGPDSALILHAYRVWGEACVEHLIGDFAFAIWDAAERKLFCARDQFGSVPFYYATIGDTFAFANTVEALLAHPGLDRTLNREAIGDYLLFGFGRNPAAGFYKHIHRLPPAHCLRQAGGAVVTRRYWEPPPSTPDPPGTDARETIERFSHVFTAAVQDRLRTDRVAVALSGGMDSTLIAGFTKRTASTAIEAYSYGGDWLLPDTERHWAFRCAHHLGIPFHSVSVEPIILNPPGGDCWRHAAEPRFEMRVMSVDAIVGRMVADGHRVLLMGIGGDTLVTSGLRQWSEMIAHGEFASLLTHAWHYWRYFHRRPPLRSAWQSYRQLRQPPPLLLPLDPDFAAEQRLEEKWRDRYMASYRVDLRRDMAENTFWSEMFVTCHPETSRLPLRVRQPFFDVRLINEAMRLPPTPWQFNKAILREIGKDVLPRDILRRPKTLFGASAHWEAARLGFEPWLKDLASAPELEGFIDRARLRQLTADVTSIPQQHYFGTILLPASLAMWLRRNAVAGSCG